MARKTVTVGSGNPTTTAAIDLPSFIKKLGASTDPSRMSKVTKMLRAERFQLFSSVTEDAVLSVVKSQTDADLMYACQLTKSGEFFCCAQGRGRGGGRRGARGGRRRGRAV